MKHITSEDVINEIKKGNIEQASVIYFDKIKKINESNKNTMKSWEEEFKSKTNSRQSLNYNTINALEEYISKNILNKKQKKNANEFLYRLYFQKSLHDNADKKTEDEINSLKKSHNAVKKLMEMDANQRNTEWLVSSYTSMTQYYLRNHLYDKAKECISECLNICNNLSNDIDISGRLELIYHLAGKSSYFLNEFNEAIKLFKKSINIAKEIKTKEEELDMLIHKNRTELRLAEAYYSNKDYKNSLLHAKKAYDVFSKNYHLEPMYTTDSYIDEKLAITSVLISKINRILKNYSNSFQIINATLRRIIFRQENILIYDLIKPWEEDYDGLLVLLLTEKANLMIDVKDYFSAKEIIKVIDNLSDYSIVAYLNNLYEDGAEYDSADELHYKLSEKIKEKNE